VTRLAKAAASRRVLLALYFGGPPGVIWLLWALIPLEVQADSPLVPLLSLGIFAIFFLVPVTLRKR
jgi:hypothetical protein